MKNNKRVFFLCMFFFQIIFVHSSGWAYEAPTPLRNLTEECVERGPQKECISTKYCNPETGKCFYHPINSAQEDGSGIKPQSILMRALAIGGGIAALLYYRRLYLSSFVGIRGPLAAHLGRGSQGNGPFSPQMPPPPSSSPPRFSSSSSSSFSGGGGSMMASGGGNAPLGSMSSGAFLPRADISLPSVSSRIRSSCVGTEGGVVSESAFVPPPLLPPFLSSLVPLERGMQERTYAEEVEIAPQASSSSSFSTSRRRLVFSESAYTSPQPRSPSALPSQLALFAPPSLSCDSEELQLGMDMGGNDDDDNAAELHIDPVSWSPSASPTHLHPLSLDARDNPNKRKKSSSPSQGICGEDDEKVGGMDEDDPTACAASSASSSPSSKGKRRRVSFSCGVDSNNAEENAGGGSQHMMPWPAAVAAPADAAVAAPVAAVVPAPVAAVVAPPMGAAGGGVQAVAAAVAAAALSSPQRGRGGNLRASPAPSHKVVHDVHGAVLGSKRT